MNTVTELVEPLLSERLILRQWIDADVAQFAALNADSQVMEHFPGLLSFAQTSEMVERVRHHIEERKFGVWATELRATGQFIGFIGLAVPMFESHFTPCVEVGWRLAKEFWGQGYAPEGAVVAMRDGFERLALTEIVSLTATTNLKSMRVMEKLGMTRDTADDFDHPRLDVGNPLRRHVLYRAKAADWLEAHKLA